MAINPISQQELAKLIAAQKGIKYKSAMRYIQRVRAPEGKQRIIHPRFIGIKPQTVKIVKQYLTIAKTQPPKIKPGVPPRVQRLGIEHLPEGDLRDKIAVMTNQIDYEDTAEALDVEFDLIEQAVLTADLNRLQISELRSAYENFYRDTDLQEDYGIDSDYVEYEAKLLSEIFEARDLEDIKIWREAIADGEVDLEKLEICRQNFRGGGDLTNHQLGMILETYAAQKRGEVTTKIVNGKRVIIRRFEINDFLEAAIADGNDINNVKDSEFWALFRELFY